MALLTYRAVLAPRSPTMTPWHADTIFGSLCWAIVRGHGPDQLAAFLHAYADDEPPLVLSNGFVGGLLPAPLVPRPRRVFATREEEQQLRDEAKRLKTRTYLTRDAFLRACAGEDVRLELQERPDSSRDTLHNTGSRLGTGSVDGALYTMTELWPGRRPGASGVAVGAPTATPEAAPIIVYALVRPDYAALIGAAWDALAATGYGRRVSVGFGQVDLLGWTEADATTGLPATLTGANGFVALSNFCPAAGDPTIGYYRTMVKYGRLGEERGTRSSPFKRPLIQLIAGSCFYTTPSSAAASPGPVDLVVSPSGGANESVPPRRHYGRLVHGIHPTQDDVVQYGLALAAPIVLPLRP